MQYDAPQHPESFIHRVGRTARIGRKGAALLYLHPEEDAYVQFMAVRHVPLAPWSERSDGLTAEGAVTQGADSCAIQGADSTTILAAARKALRGDRDLFDKSERAFVSYVAGYQEHTCNFIFRWGNFDVGRIATGFGLLRMPRLKHKDLAVAGKKKGKDKSEMRSCTFDRDTVDTNTIAYKDKVRERLRQEKLAERKSAAQEGEKMNMTQRKKRKLEQEEAKSAASAKKLKEARGHVDLCEAADTATMNQDMQDDEAMEYESKLLKKLKAGKSACSMLGFLCNLPSTPGSGSDYR